MLRSSRRKSLRESARSAPVRTGANVDWARARWDALTPELKFVMSSSQVLLVGTMLLHGLSGPVYGQLSVFLAVGFAEMPGWVALWGATSVWCLAAAVATHLAERYLPSMGALRCARWRLQAYVAAAVLWGISLLLWLLSTPGMWGSLGVWPGLAPRSEWLLALLPWAWEWMLPAARDDVQRWWLGIALASILLSACCFERGRWPRTGLAFMATALLASGLWALGGAAYHYVAGRSFAGVTDVIAVLNLQSHPGQRNADTLLWLVWAWFLLGLGALVMVVVLHTPSEELQRS